MHAVEQKDLPIGIYDSGMGGISVLREAVRQMPAERYIYFGDDLHAPYGTKDENTIRDLSLACADFLNEKGVKMMVIACNTATSVVVQTMRERYRLPVISMEPAIKPPADKYPDGAIAVFATPATLRQARYGALMDRLGIRGRIRNIACDRLASLVERAPLDGNEIHAYIRDRMHMLEEEENVCAIVLGCTHYTFAARAFQEEAVRVLGCMPEIFDGVSGTVRRMRQVLHEQDLLRGGEKTGEISLFTSGDAEVLARMHTFLALP